jgi:hypothetical protein
VALLVSACATAPGGELVWIEVSGDTPCTIELDDRRFTLPADRPRFQAAARGIARRSEGAVVGEVANETSFACWTSAIHALQGVGFRRLGLISEHEPGEN